MPPSPNIFPHHQGLILFTPDKLYLPLTKGAHANRTKHRHHRGATATKP
jgi:hypothetical protein